VAIVIPKRIAERVEKEARRLGLSIEEYLLDILTRDLDPKGKAKEYIDTAYDLINQAREELKKGDAMQAAEKIWGASALAVKAYAYWKEGRKISSHKELWEYKDIIIKEIGEWIRDSWNAGNSMHTCFYEGWCTKTDIESALTKVEKLVNEVKARIKDM